VFIMSDIQFPCSGCGVTLRVISNPALVGKKLRCPKCAAVTPIPQAEPIEEAALVEPEPEETGEEITSAPSPSRKPKALPAPPESIQPTARGKARAPAADLDEEEPPRKPRRSKKPRSRIAPVVIGICVGVFVLAYAGVLGCVYFDVIRFNNEVAADSKPNPNPNPDPRIVKPPFGQNQGPAQPFQQPDPKEEARNAESHNKQLLERITAEKPLLAALQQSADGKDGHKALAVFAQHQQPITQLAFSPTSPVLASIAKDSTVKLWDLQKGGLLHDLPAGSVEGGQLAFSPNGQLLAATSENLRVKVFEAGTGRLQVELQPKTPRKVQWVAFSPEGNSVFAGGQALERWDVKTGKLSQHNLRETIALGPMAFRFDFRFLAAKSMEGNVQIYDFMHGHRFDRVFRAPGVQFLTFSPDGWTVAAIDMTTGTPVVQLYTLPNERRLPVPTRAGVVSSVAFSPDGKYLALGGSAGPGQGFVELWDPAAVKPAGIIQGPEVGEVASIAISPGGLLLASGDARGSVRIWSMADILVADPAGSLPDDLKKAVTVQRQGKDWHMRLRQTATDDAIAQLAKVKGLTELSFGSCENVTEKGFAGLKDLKELQRLDLSTPEPTTRVTDACLAHLNGLPRLTKLNLSGAGVTDAGLAQLKDLPNLEELHLSGASVTNAGLVGLSAFPKLTSLDLSATAITEAGLAHLAGLPELKTLDLSSMKALKGGDLRALKDLPRLTELHLVAAPIADADLAALAPLAQLETLYLMQTPVTDAGLVHLYGLKKLKTVGLTWTEVTEAGLAALRKALPQVQASKF
jgi:Leucine rich repeat/WD domain, G-beta repeat/Leucine Rich repeat